MTIRTRLALWYAGLLTGIVLIFSAVVFAVMQVAMLDTIDQVLERSASEAIQNIRVVPFGELGTLRTQVRFRSDTVFQVPGISLQVWQTHDGNNSIQPVLVRSSNDLLGYNNPLDAASIRTTQEIYSSVPINDIPGRVATRPFFAGGRQVGVIQVATPIQTVQQTNEVLLVIMLIASAISVFVAVVLGMWLSARSLRPINKIADAATRIANTDDLSTRLDWDGPMDELGRLAKVFNHMMDRLESLFKVQQRFVADVSHELRTPLTSIQGNLQIIERYGMDMDALDAIRGESERMSRMVNDLLLLARADYGELKVDLYPLDLDHVVLDVYEQSLILAKNRRLKILLGKIEPVRIRGNSDRLRQLLLNLIGNAIKFTPDGGKIIIDVHQEAEKVVLSVQDTGIGISEEDLKHIFDRFFQVDGSRTHRYESDGAGLGLSIARWIVDVHEGKIGVQSTLGEGTKFYVHLPLYATHFDDSQPSNGNGYHSKDSSTHQHSILRRMIPQKHD